MNIRGKVVSISKSYAEVCILENDTTCGSCTACPKKQVLRETIKVAPIKGIHIGQEVVLQENKNWLNKNKIVTAVLGFIAGVIIAEAISLTISYGVYRTKIDMLAGCLMIIISLIVARFTRRNFRFRIKLIKRGKT